MFHFAMFLRFDSEPSTIAVQATGKQDAEHLQADSEVASKIQNGTINSVISRYGFT